MRTIETKITGWALIVSAVLLIGGWLLIPHHIGEYFVADDFEAVGKNLWYWIWMFRFHIFGWVLMGGSMIAIATLMNKEPSRILIVPGAGIVVVGTFTLAFAMAFYYSYGAWGVGMTSGKSQEEIQLFTDNLIITNHYITCLLRFGRIFSGVGFLLLGIGIIKWNLMNKIFGIFTALMGLAAMCVILLIPDNFEVYKPLFYLKGVWLILAGLIFLRKGVNLPSPKQ